MNRRQFLKAGGVALAFSIVAPRLSRGTDHGPLRIGVIGAGWYGKVNLFRFMETAPVEVVALCDVDRKVLAEAADMVVARQRSAKKPRLYSDYRQMLKEKDLDVAIVGTPDHWHALAMVAAAEAGADVYVEKPISVDVVEGQAMVAAARRLGRVVQVNTQRRSTPHLIEARDRIINEGKLGRVGLVEIYCYYHMRPGENPPDTNPPDHLDYGMWTGPAPSRPYNSLVHPRNWRMFNEYGNGIIGDMGVHMFDAVRWMLGLGWPKRISSCGGVLVDKSAKANIPDTQTATFEYDELKVVWQHRTWGDPPDPKYPWGITFYGEKGTLKASISSYDFFPLYQTTPIHADALTELDRYPGDQNTDVGPTIGPACRRHVVDFLEAVRYRRKPVADIEQGHISTASCILANLSMRLGRTLTWDEKAGRLVGDPQANELLRRAYRKPWQHPTESITQAGGTTATHS